MEDGEDKAREREGIEDIFWMDSLKILINCHYFENARGLESGLMPT